MPTRLSRPSPALVISLIALFVALGGTGYAAATGSIDSREIKNSTIQGKDVKNSSLTGSDVKNDSLSGSDIVESKLAKVPAAGRADGAGRAETAGRADTAGSAGSAATATSAGNAGTVGGRSAESLTVRCPAGTRLLNGSCFETSNRPAANYDAASKACAADQRRLPTFSELLGVSASDSSLPTTMTSDLYNFNGGVNYIQYFPGGIVALASLTSTTGFRCVAPLTN